MEMSKEKKSKTAGKAPLIVVSILLVLTLVVNVVCIQMFSAINTFMAANLNSRLPGAHGSATAEQLTPEQAKEAALAMAQELAAEGIVLLENKDRVLTRETLLDAVWGFDFVGETNSVDVYIRFLRSKLDDTFGLKLIHTVRGVGYVIKEES